MTRQKNPINFNWVFFRVFFKLIKHTKKYFHFDKVDIVQGMSVVLGYNQVR